MKQRAPDALARRMPRARANTPAASLLCKTGSGFTLLAALLLVVAAPMPVAIALVPGGERVADAIVTRNAAVGRARALRFELEMRVAGSAGSPELAEGPPVAHGELVTHPSGMARLELRGRGDLVEKHLLHGSVHLASRNERPLLEPRSFLPPLFLLQIDSAAALRSALIAFRIHPDQIGFAPCDESDCYVVGDPARVPPQPPRPDGPERLEAQAAQADQVEEADPVEQLEEGDAVDPSGEFAQAAGSERSPVALDPVLSPEILAALAAVDEGESGAVSSDWMAEAEFEPGMEEELEIEFPLAPGELPATLWIDTQTLDPRRMRLANGARVRFGPYMKFGRVRVPLWLQIEEERGVVRFDVLEVTPVNAPAAAFDASWLAAPAASFSRPAGTPEIPGE